VHRAFQDTGDMVRNSSPNLESVINAGIRTIIYDGDADYDFNFIGVEAMVDNLHTRFAARYRSRPWTKYKVAGQVAGQYKQAGTFSYLRVYGAGHLVPAYKYGTLEVGQAALQMFNQIMLDQSLSST